MKINFGACRAIGVRTAQIEAYAMIALNWLGIPPAGLTIGFLALLGAGWFIFDWKVVWPQEQAFAFRNNTEFQELKRHIERGK